MTYRVIVATTLSEAGLDLLRGEIGGLAKIILPEQLKDKSTLETADALIIRDETKIDKAILDLAPNLKVIGRAGAGIADIDVDTATHRGIMVMNTPGINAISVAEYTFAMLLGLARHVVQAHSTLAQGTWNRDGFVGNELYKKAIGIIGLGRVGIEVAQRAAAFGMNILGFDPYVNETELNGLPIKLVGLEELLSTVDVITVHSSLTTETENMLNAETLALIKRGVWLINTANGKIIDENALLQQLNSGRIAGAAIDVFASEPSIDSPLIHHDKVLHTPHLGGNTHEAQHDLGILIVRQVLDALHGHDYRNVVNMPFEDDLSFAEIAPYMKLAEKIGILQHHLARHEIQRITIEFKGEEFQTLIKPMTVGLLYGLLKPIFGDAINYINAPLLAHERNIFVTQAKNINRTHYGNLLSCQAQWSDGELVIGGALFNHTDPHIVEIDQYHTNFQPDGVLLIIGSFDIPGVIGHVGLLLAENNINIANWRTGRAERGGHTLSVVSLDEPLSSELIETLRTQEYIRHATQIIF